MVQEGETTTENHEMAKLMGRIAKGLGVIDGALNGGSTKVTIGKATRLLCKEGNQDQTSATMAKPSESVHGDTTPGD